MVKFMETAEVELRIRNTRIIDLRDKEYYYVGHIEGACWMPYSLMTTQAEELLHPEEIVILYDDHGGIGRAFDVADMLEQLGYRSVYVYKYGWEGWERGHPTALKDSFFMA